MSQLERIIIEELIKHPPSTRAEINQVKRVEAKKAGKSLPAADDVIRAYRTLVQEKRIEKNTALESLLQRRPMRTRSGVAIITVLAKPYPCPGTCTYCPTEARMPKSYLEREPAAQRALMLKFDPYVQVQHRITSLDANGHPTDKIELIVKGGTWSAYTPKYQRWFIKRCYDACNEYSEQRTEKTARRPMIDPDTRQFKNRRALEQHQTRNLDGWASGDLTNDTALLAAQDENEHARHRIIGLTLETRPDWITPKEVYNLRVLGCTRIELGVQHTDNAILDSIKRGHHIEDAKRAALLLRAAGFKVDFHLMPQLPTATPKKDITMFDTLWNDPDLRPDMIKIYPCVVLESAELYQEWKTGKYKPYGIDELIRALITIKSRVPRYVRISRLIRDIPSEYIFDGNPVTNLREIVQRMMRERGIMCRCLRCREIGRKDVNREPWVVSPTKLFIDEYEASGGKEYFLSYEDEKRTMVYAFCRLRLPKHETREENDMKKIHELLPETKDAAFIRELHTYGHLIPIDQEATDEVTIAQHKGLGKKLMKEAEVIAKREGFRRMTVISGVGVRAYYEKLGYKKKGTYMVKKLS